MSQAIKPQTSNLKHQRRGFTLIEILVVIGIIVVLLSILIPTISKIRKNAQVVTVKAQLSDLAGLIEQYQQDHKALPGPLPFDQIRSVDPAFTMTTDNAAAGTAGFEGTDVAAAKITMSENLVLGLAGGLEYFTSGGPGTGIIRYDPTLVGTGAGGLNPASPKKGRAYIDQKNLSWRQNASGLKTGKYEDGAGAADDTIIPEILDTFPSPMPILYLRARKGSRTATAVTLWDVDDNGVITFKAAAPDPRVGQYDLSQILGYTGPGPTGTYIGEGKDITPTDYKNFPVAAGPGNLPHGLSTIDATLKASRTEAAPAGFTYVYPYDAYAYFRDPTSSDVDPQPRAKDTYILISAGLDRVYGTADDLTSFGEVNP